MSVDYTSLHLSLHTMSADSAVECPLQRSDATATDTMYSPPSLDSMSVDYTSIYLSPSHNVIGLHVPLPLPTMSMEYTSISLSLHCQWTIMFVCLFPPCQWTQWLNVLSREHATATMYAPPSLDTMSVDYTSTFLSPPCQWTIRPSFSPHHVSGLCGSTSSPESRCHCHYVRLSVSLYRVSGLYIHLSLPIMPVDYTSLHLSLLTMSVDYTSISLSLPCQRALRFNVLSREQMPLPLYIMYVPPSLDIMSVDSAVERFDKSCPGQGRRQEH